MQKGLVSNVTFVVSRACEYGSAEALDGLKLHVFFF